MLVNFINGQSDSNEINFDILNWIIWIIGDDAFIPLRAKRVREFIEIRHKKISSTRIMKTTPNCPSSERPKGCQKRNIFTFSENICTNINAGVSKKGIYKYI